MRPDFAIFGTPQLSDRATVIGYRSFAGALLGFAGGPACRQDRFIVGRACLAAAGKYLHYRSRVLAVVEGPMTKSEQEEWACLRLTRRAWNIIVGGGNHGAESRRVTEVYEMSHEDLLNLYGVGPVAAKELKEAAADYMTRLG